MDDDDIRPKPSEHNIGMALDALSIAELQARIALLQDEIGRLKAAIEAKGKSRSAAEAAFKI